MRIEVLAPCLVNCVVDVSIPLLLGLEHLRVSASHLVQTQWRFYHSFYRLIVFHKLKPISPVNATPDILKQPHQYEI